MDAVSKTSLSVHAHCAPNYTFFTLECQLLAVTLKLCMDFEDKHPAARANAAACRLRMLPSFIGRATNRQRRWQCHSMCDGLVLPLHSLHLVQKLPSGFGDVSKHHDMLALVSSPQVS